MAAAVVMDHKQRCDSSPHRLREERAHSDAGIDTDSSSLEDDSEEGSTSANEEGDDCNSLIQAPITATLSGHFYASQRFSSPVASERICDAASSGSAIQASLLAKVAAIPKESLDGPVVSPTAFQCCISTHKTGINSFKTSMGRVASGHDISVQASAQQAGDVTADEHVPEMVASETVVTTTQSTFFSVARAMKKSPSGGSGCLPKMYCDDSATSDSAVSLIPLEFNNDDTDELNLSDHSCARARKERNKERKLVRRQCPEYRLSELAKSRARMRLKRTDPSYREQERQRDRERRRCSRQMNATQREAEKARDKDYRRRMRLLLSRTSMDLDDGDSSGAASVALSAVDAASAELSECSRDSAVVATVGIDVPT